MRFENTTDRDLIRSVLCLPQIYGALHDDYAGPAEEWEPIDAPGFVGYVKVTDEEEFLGIVIVSTHSRIMWELHAALLPHVGWKRRLRAAAELFAWLPQFGCLRVIGKVCATNRYALRFNKAIGMKRFGVNERAFMKNGILQDEVWFGLGVR